MGIIWLYTLSLTICSLHIWLLGKSLGSYQHRQYQGFLDLMRFNYQLLIPHILLQALMVVFSQRIMLIKTWWVFKDVEYRVNLANSLLSQDLLKPVDKTKIEEALKVNLDTLKFCQDELGFVSPWNDPKAWAHLKK